MRLAVPMALQNPFYGHAVYVTRGYYVKGSKRFVQSEMPFERQVHPA